MTSLPSLHADSCPTRLGWYRCGCPARFVRAQPATEPDRPVISPEPEVMDAQAALTLSLLAMARLVTTR